MKPIYLLIGLAFSLETMAYKPLVPIKPATPASTTLTEPVAARTPADTSSSVRSMRIRALGSTPAPLGFIEYLPPDYEKLKDLPLVIFLHGIGENFPTPISQIMEFGPNRYIKLPATTTTGFPFVALSPQNGGKTRWQKQQVKDLIEYAKKTYKIDPDRIHLTGLSLGGGGTLDYIRTFAGDLASASIMCPGRPYPTQEEIDTLLAMKLPMWMVMAHNDAVVNFDASAKLFANRVGTSLGITEDVMHHVTNPAGALDGKPVSEIAASSDGSTVLPSGIFSLTPDPAKGTWQMKKTLDATNADGFVPSYPFTLTVVTEMVKRSRQPATPNSPAVSASDPHWVWTYAYDNKAFWQWMQQKRR